MSSEFRLTKLGALSAFKYGKFLAKANLDRIGYPVFSGYGVVGHLPGFEFEKAQLVVVCRGAGGTGDIKMSPAKCSITNLSIIISPNQQLVRQDFLYWALKNADTHSLRTGSAQPQIVIGDLQNFSVAVPSSLHVQEQIAMLLSSLESRIVLLRETNATLEAIAQALFKSWFVDFDPVRAKQEGRAPDGMDEATAALFPDDFEQSATGSVPMGWRNGTLADLADLNPESWTSRIRPETIQYVDLANAKNNEIDEVTTFAFDEAPSRARRVLRVGDTVIGTVRPGNRSFAYIYEATGNLTGSTGFAGLRPRYQNCREYLFFAATLDASIEHLAHVADGGAYPAVRPEAVANLRTVLPNEDVLDAFHLIAAPIFLLVGENKSRIRTLTTIRDLLLPRLISGQLRLPEAAEPIKHAA